ncbi:hypothetical protein D3C76_513400 [compost metagenome]
MGALAGKMDSPAGFLVHGQIYGDSNVLLWGCYPRRFYFRAAQSLSYFGAAKLCMCTASAIHRGGAADTINIYEIVSSGGYNGIQLIAVTFFIPTFTLYQQIYNILLIFSLYTRLSSTKLGRGKNE